ncbi:uncharacterized protein isoform X2 [Choristoneura fumiferana]|uniref:uncharacterized protein isoform X2 n=1 Tax=Choristoneura fumiferana TaxID=7141 RepID=UPI003D15ED02
MKIRIILIVLDFIQLCFSLQTNLTYNNEHESCPNSSSRAKRALSEYTRWRANQPTKQEFIVKVDDDVLNPTVRASTQVFAINIQPFMKKPQMIIVSGAAVSTAKVAPTTYVPLEYTRFVPPTTLKITQFNGDLYLLERDPLAEEDQSPKDEINSPPPILAPKNPQRDESPPASPQFISRTPAHVVRQYAPITPVAFFPLTGVSPLTPPPLKKPVHRTTLIPPPVRSTLPNFEIPTRIGPAQEVLEKFKPDTNLLESLLIPSDTEGIKEISEPTAADQYFPDTVTPTRVTYTTQNWSEEDEVTSTLKTTSTDLESGYHIAYDDIDDTESTTGNTESDKSLEEEDTRKNADNSRHESEEDYVSTDSENYVDNTTSLSIEDVNFEDQNDKTTLEKDTAETKTTHYYNTSATLVYDYDETSTPQSFREKRRPSCNLRKLRDLSFKSPRTLPEIVAQLKKWTDDSPIAKWVDITDDTYTVMENPIYMMIIDDPSSGQILSAKQVVLIVAGIQGRDHHAVAAALYVLYQLIERSESHADLLSKYRFWVVPVLNPDGYDYSMTFPQRREWTKNLRQSWDTCSVKESCLACESTGLRCTVQPCYGVNLDRNFEYQWIPPEERRSEHACGDLYAGPRQLSELETAAITHFLHVQGSPLHTFIAFKEGDVLRQRASKAASAAYSISGRPYVAGQTSEFLPLYAGGIEDWVDGHLGIDNTYSVMIFRPTDANNPRVTTERVVHEAYAAMDTLLLQSLEPYNTQILRQVRGTSSVKTTPSLLTNLAACILVMRGS